MNRAAQGFLLFLVGGAVLRASLSQEYLRFVKPGLRPLLLAAAAVLMLTAAATIWPELRRHRDRAGAEPTDGDGHGHSHNKARVAWLLLLPLFALIALVPPPLGSYAADRTGTALQPPLAYANLPAKDPIQLTLLDYAGRAVYDHGRSLSGRRVEFSGFITFGSHGVPYLTRMILNCCAADAQPVKVALTGALPEQIRPDLWLDVVGRYDTRQSKDEVNGGPIPYLDVVSAHPVSPPADPYES
ncbi:MAG: TIGR03943 family protein [Micromonosporaceae bacterium]|nr:TIGR03943 family protein [Micromonosporaceae bacterium]